MVDPINHLSPEALTQIFSYLSTPALTRCNSISKAWRREILVDSVLHRNLDLTSIKDSVTPIELMQLINDLASRSSHVYKELHLDLTCFWDELAKACIFERFDGPVTFDKAMAVTSYNYSSLISTIRLATRGQLERLFVKVSLPEEMEEDTGLWDNTVPLSQILIQGGSMLSEAMHSLKELHFEVPFPFSMSLGGSSSELDAKRFTIVRMPMESFSGDGLLCLRSLKKAQEFAGSNLDTFELNDSESFYREDQRRTGNLKLFLQAVKGASKHLRRLYLRIDEKRYPDVALDLVANCPNLSSLELSLRSGEFYKEPTKQIKSPLTNFSSQIKSLELKLVRIDLDWGSQALRSWLGTNLEYFQLSNEEEGLRKREIYVPLEALHSILNQFGLLKKLELEGVSVLASTPSIGELSLENLETLELLSMDFLGNTLFSDLSAPKLKRIKVALHSEISTERDFALRNLAYLLGASHSSLKELRIRTNNETPELDLEQPTVFNFYLTLSELEELDLQDWEIGPSRLHELLNTLRLPKIKRLSHSSNRESEQMPVQLLAASRFSLERVIIRRHTKWCGGRRSDENISTMRRYQATEWLTFSQVFGSR